MDKALIEEIIRGLATQAPVLLLVLGVLYFVYTKFERYVLIPYKEHYPKLFEILNKNLLLVNETLILVKETEIGFRSLRDDHVWKKSMLENLDRKFDEMRCRLEQFMQTQSKCYEHHLTTYSILLKSLEDLKK